MSQPPHNHIPEPNFNRVALVTGANQGLGYFVVQQLATSDPQLRVLLGSRDPAKGHDAQVALGLKNVVPLTLDINDQSSIQEAAARIQKEYGGLDILCNNAGMAFKGDQFDTHVVDTTFLTNVKGTRAMVSAFLPLMKSNGRIVNVSSMSAVSALKNMSEEHRKAFLADDLDEAGLMALLAQFRKAVEDGTTELQGWPKSAYGMSKLAVAVLTRIDAKKAAAQGKGVTVNHCCPGWCRTSMAGDKAPRAPEEGAATITAVCQVADNNINGKFFEDKQVSDKFDVLAGKA